MILGVGIDIVHVKKVEIGLLDDAFRRKVFTPAELEIVEQYKSQAEHLAGKYAAKEAFMKAIGAGIRQEVWFTQIEVLNDESGRPQVYVNGEAEKRLREIKAETIHVSISHSGGVAVAVVILE